MVASACTHTLFPTFANAASVASACTPTAERIMILPYGDWLTQSFFNVRHSKPRPPGSACRKVSRATFEYFLSFSSLSSSASSHPAPR
jgi:hypothetical protein